MKVNWKWLGIGILILFTIAIWPLVAAGLLGYKGYQIRKTGNTKFYFIGAVILGLVIFPIWSYFMLIEDTDQIAKSIDQFEANTTLPSSQIMQDSLEKEPKIQSICYSISDTKRDAIYESKDYFLWNVGIEKCDSPITEEDIRNYYISLDYQYCRYPSIRIAVEFENVESLDRSSVKLFNGNKTGMFGTIINDILEWYDFSNDLEESGLTENGLFVNGTYYITVASGTSQDTFTLEDNESEKLYGKNGSFEATLFYKSNSNNEYRNSLTLPFIDPFECAEEE